MGREALRAERAIQRQRESTQRQEAQGPGVHPQHSRPNPNRSRTGHSNGKLKDGSVSELGFHYVAQAAPELTHSVHRPKLVLNHEPPALASQVLGLWVCATTPC